MHRGYVNYFAHGVRFIDRPYFLAGTAVPDWLSVADRKVRMRAKQVAPYADGSTTIQAELAAGVLQHLEDDGWFHVSSAFYETSGALTRIVRQQLGPEDGFRPGFLGHVITEMVLDAVLMDLYPQLLDDYYDALAQLNAEEVQQAVNCMARVPTSRLAILIPRFQDEQFLRDYRQPSRLLFRLNQVMRRIKLRHLPDEFEEVISAAHELVRPRAGELLPASRFSNWIL
jgi:hypothetical protein